MDPIIYKNPPSDYDTELDNRVKKIMGMDILERISELAYLCFPPSEIAILCGMDIEIFLAEVAFNTSNKAKAYWVGKMRYKLKQRLITLDFALRGSPQAEESMVDFYNKMKEEENE